MMGGIKILLKAGLHQLPLVREMDRREALRQHYAGGLKFNWNAHDLNEIFCQEGTLEMHRAVVGHLFLF